MFLAINPNALDLGFLTIRWYAVIIMAGAMLASYLAQRQANQKGLSKDYIYDLLFYLLPIGILGARIYYVVFKWEDYQSQLHKIFYIWEGGLAIYGGLIAGLGCIYWYARKHNVSFLATLDMITPGVLLAQAIGRWGNFVNQEAYGDVVSRTFLEQLHLPNFMIEQMFIEGQYYHPTFLYESIASFIGVIVLMLIRHYYKGLRLGDLSLFYVIWYGIERFFVEGMRSDSLWLGPLRVSQALSLVLVVVSVILYVYNRKKQTVYYHSYYVKKY